MKVQRNCKRKENDSSQKNLIVVSSKDFWLRQVLKEWQSLSVRHGDELSSALNLHISGSNPQAVLSEPELSFSTLSALSLKTLNILRSTYGA